MRGKLITLSGSLLLFAMLFALTILPSEAAPLNVKGSIHTINLKTKTVNVKKGDGSTLTLKINSTTAITRNGKNVGLSKLVLGDAVSANYNANSKTASNLKATGPAANTVSGSVLKAQKGTGVVTLSSGTIKTGANTKIVRNGKIVSLTQVTNHDRLTAHLKTGTKTAFDLIDEGPDEGQVEGAITALNGNAVTITPTGGGTDVVVTVDSNTQIEVNDADASLGDLQLNMVVSAEYDPTTMVAFSIEAQSEGDSGELSGTVSAVDTTNGTVSITPDGGGADVVLTVDASTDIQVNGEDATLADVQVGMPVQAEYDTATMVANQLDVGNDGGDGGGDNGGGGGGGD